MRDISLTYKVHLAQCWSITIITFFKVASCFVLSIYIYIYMLFCRINLPNTSDFCLSAEERTC